MSIARILVGVAVTAAVGYAGYKGYEALFKKKRGEAELPKNEKKDVEIPLQSKKFESEENPAFDKFLVIYDGLVARKHVIAYRPEWANGTGYFNGIFDEVLLPGHWAFEDEHGRKAIVSSDRTRGHVVLFQRYVEGNTLAVCAPFNTGFSSIPNEVDLRRFCEDKY